MRKQAEVNLSALIESTKDLIWSVDLSFGLVTFNGAVQRSIEENLGRQVLAGMHPVDLVPPEEAGFWTAIYERALSQGSFRIELPYPGKRTYELALSPIEVNGKKMGISVFGKDITDKKAAEKALQEAEKKYRTIFDGALEGMFQTSPEAKVLIVNPALARMLGYDSPEDLLSNVRNAIEDVWVDAEEHAQFTKKIMESGTVRGFEARFRRKDGAIIWCSLSCRRVCGRGGELLYIEGFLEGISERKAAETALQETERKYRAIFDGALEGMFQTSVEGIPLAANRALAKMLGYDSPEDFLSSVKDVGESIWASPSDRVEMLRRLEVAGATLGFECQLKRKDKTEFWVSLSCRKVCGPDGRVLNLEGFIEDITERKQASLALSESEARFRKFFEENGSVMLLVEPSTGEIVAANRKAIEFYGYPKEQLIGMFTYQISLSPPEEIARDRQRALRRESACFHYRHKLASGEVRDIEMYSSPFEVDGRQILYAIIHDVTERNRSALALTESEARFRRLFEENGSVMVVVDPASGEIRSANRAAINYYGYTQEALIGMSVDRINTLPAEEVALRRRQALREERTRFNFRHRLASGEVRDVEVYSSPMTVDGRQLLFSVVHDVTERKRAEEALRESLESLEEAQTIGGLGIYSLDIATGVWTSSSVLDELFGIGKDYDHTVAGWTLLIHPDDEQSMASYFANEVVGKGKPFDREYRIIRKTDKAVRWLHGQGKLDFDAQGQPTRMHGVIKDITQRKQSETELRNSEERFRSTFEQAAVGILHTALDGQILRCNERFAEIIGYPLDEIPGMSFQQITLPEDVSESVGMLKQMLDGKTSRAGWEKRYVRKDRSLTWVKLTASIQRDDEGLPLHFIVVVEDINDRKAAEERLAAAREALQASETRYRTAFETSQDSISINRLDDGLYIDASPSFLKIMGYTREEVVGHTSLELRIWVNPSERAFMVETLREKGMIQNLESQLRKKDGTIFWGLSSATRIMLDGIPCLLAVIRDITASKAAAEALRTSEERYRSAFQTSLDGVSITHLDDGRYVDVNQAFLRIFGYRREEVIGKTSKELHIWADPDDRRKFVDVLRRDSVCENLELRAQRKGGQKFWVLASASVIELNGVSCVHFAIRDISAAKAAAEALRTTEERYRTAFQTSHDGISISHLESGLYVDINHAFLRTFGYKREEVIGRTSLELNVWADPDDRRKMVEVLQRDSVCENLEVRFQRKSGQMFWVLVSASVIMLDGISCVLFVIRDISAAKAASERLASTLEALRTSEVRYRTAFETSLDSININRLNDGAYVEVNKAFLDVVGYERHEVIGRTPMELGVWNDPHDQENLLEILRQDSHCRDFEAQFKRKNGEIFWGLMSAALIEVEGVPCVLTMTRDISNAKLAEDKIRNLAFYDPLTGLPNRRLLMERLQQALAASTRTSNMRVLMFVDLDNFKNLNDTLGHQAGDLLLQEIARRLTSCVRDSDTVARLGGDEFVVLLEGLSETAQDAASQAKAVAEKILAAIRQPYELDGRESFSTSSIGITVFGNQRESTNEVMQQADIAMYQAKAAGRNTLRFFAPALQAAVNARAAMEDALRQALKADQFLLYYQPQVDSGRLVGAEALVRWEHPGRGVLLPGEFISLAEETGLILQLGTWVLETACNQIASWAERKETAHIKLAVNISARQFRQPDFVEQVLIVLERTGANPQNLQLELTESMLVDNVQEVIGIMAELKSHGVRFSLDDFGTGYSSLSYLKHLPLDQLKIDRSFVRDMLTDASSGAIAQTLISLGKAMGLSVIAEGVETQEQMGFLAGLGCRTYQGFLFDRPLPLEEFQLKWMSSSNHGNRT